MGHTLYLPAWSIGPDCYNEVYDIARPYGKKAGMSEIYLHQVFSGRRNPSRDRLLCLCIGLGCSLEETQRLLQQASYAQLYPRIKRDAIITHGILHGTDLNDINDKLFSENEKTLL